MLLVFACLLSCATCTNGHRDIDTLVLCPSEFQEALRPWTEYRLGQGYKILVQAPSSTAAGLRAQIRQVAEKSPLKNVVLVGDAADVRVPQSRLLPTDFITAKVNVRFGSEPEIATDHRYADLNDDGILEFNIGRIPVDSADELQSYISRVKKYERNKSSGSWQRRVNFVAGVGGFSQMLDKMIEQSVKKIVTDLIPSAYDVSMTYGSWQSPYCPDPRQFSRTAIDRFNEGCLFWVYVGHGDRQRLDRLKLPDRQFEILNNSSASQISSKSGSPIAVFLSCYTAAVDDQNDGLAEVMFRQTRGPIGIISSSRVSMPYAMGIFSLELLDGYFQGDASTLGELVKVSKNRMVKFEPKKSNYHRLIESMGQAFSPEPGLLVAERKEHVHLMHLLGDPLLKLHRPNNLKLDAPKNIASGQQITVSGFAEQSGELKMDLAYRRDRFRNRPPRRRSYEPSHATFASYQKVYEETQDLKVQTISRRISKGPFSIQMAVPDDCSGDCHIRGELVAENYFAIGATDIEIR